MPFVDVSPSAEVSSNSSAQPLSPQGINNNNNNNNNNKCIF